MKSSIRRKTREFSVFSPRIANAGAPPGLALDLPTWSLRARVSRLPAVSRDLRLPASEPQKNIVIAFCVIAMSIMSIGLVWQAQIIASQREAIRWLASAAKYGG